MIDSETCFRNIHTSTNRTFGSVEGLGEETHTSGERKCTVIKLKEIFKHLGKYLLSCLELHVRIDISHISHKATRSRLA